MTVSVVVDTSAMEKQFIKDMGAIAKQAIPPAKRSALLRVSRSALGRAVRGAAKRARVKAKLIRARSSNKPFKDGRMLSINTAPIPVAIMGPKGRLPNQTRNGIRIAGRHYPKGFIATAKKGKLKKTVFQREGEARVPLDEISIPVEQEIKAAGPPAVRRAVEQRFPKEFEHNFKRSLKRIIRKSNAENKARLQKIARKFL